MIDVLAIGELLIDFTPFDGGRNKPCFEQNPGGAPPNLLTMVAKLGGKAAFIGKVGSDAFGMYLVDVLNQHGINTSGIRYCKDITTTLAFVHLDRQGDRSFSFCRKPGADVLLEQGELDKTLIDQCQIFHFGSLSFTDEPIKSTVLYAVQYAKEQGKLISYDPNYRPALWVSEQEAVKQMRTGLKLADVVKLSEEEAELLTGETKIERAAEQILDMGVSLVLITLGQGGSYAATKIVHKRVNAFAVKAIDTTGAGDVFLGAILYHILRKKNVSELKEEDLADMLRYANACSAICVQTSGGIPSVPSIKQIKQFLADR